MKRNPEKQIEEIINDEEPIKEEIKQDEINEEIKEETIQEIPKPKSEAKAKSKAKPKIKNTKELVEAVQKLKKKTITEEQPAPVKVEK